MSSMQCVLHCVSMSSQGSPKSRYGGLQSLSAPFSWLNAVQSPLAQRRNVIHAVCITLCKPHSAASTLCSLLQAGRRQGTALARRPT